MAYVTAISQVIWAVAFIGHASVSASRVMMSNADVQANAASAKQRLHENATERLAEKANDGTNLYSRRGDNEEHVSDTIQWECHKYSLTGVGFIKGINLVGPNTGPKRRKRARLVREGWRKRGAQIAFEEWNGTMPEYLRYLEINNPNRWCRVVDQQEGWKYKFAGTSGLCGGCACCKTRPSAIRLGVTSNQSEAGVWQMELALEADTEPQPGTPVANASLFQQLDSSRSHDEQCDKIHDDDLYIKIAPFWKEVCQLMNKREYILVDDLAKFLWAVAVLMHYLWPVLLFYVAFASVTGLIYFTFFMAKGEVYKGYSALMQSVAGGIGWFLDTIVVPFIVLPFIVLCLCVTMGDWNYAGGDDFPCCCCKYSGKEIRGILADLIYMGPKEEDFHLTVRSEMMWNPFARNADRVLGWRGFFFSD